MSLEMSVMMIGPK